MPNDSKNLPYNYPDQSEEKVYQPSWGLFANQDIPFKDGISGSINITITAQTNICVGGEQIKNEDEPNVTQFYKLPDGQYAIPWSSVKGMVRSLMKAATFGRADQVTDEYSGIRRRPAGANTSDYNRLRDEVNDCLGYGFIKKNNDAEPVLIEYTTYEKISYENLSQAGFTHNASIEKKYKWYAEQKNNNQHLNELKGKLVFGTHCGARENEHLFSNPVEDKPILLTKEQFKRFSDTYIKQDKSQRRAASQCPWQSYWKNQYEQGQEVPVFLFKDGRNNIKHISMTKLPKFASNYSTHDMLKKVNPQHLENVDFDTHLPDLAECILGFTTESGEIKHNLAGRVNGTPFRLSEKKQAIESDPLRLLQPRAGHPSTRIQQPYVNEQNNKVPENETFYTPLSSANPRLRLFNRYYARERVLNDFSNTENNPKLDRRLENLPPGSEFKGTIRFHNLKACELGALLWVLNWGGDDDCWHNLGSGKPYGYGCITIKTTLDPEEQRFNYNADVPDDVKQHCIAAFTTSMDAEFPRWEKWENHPRISSLKSIANPKKNADLKTPATGFFPYPEPQTYNAMEQNREVLAKPE